MINLGKTGAEVFQFGPSSDHWFELFLSKCRSRSNPYKCVSLFWSHSESSRFVPCILLFDQNLSQVHLSHPAKNKYAYTILRVNMRRIASQSWLSIILYIIFYILYFIFYILYFIFYILYFIYYIFDTEY